MVDSGVPWIDKEQSEDGWYEYCWAGTPEQVANLVAGLPSDAAVVPVWQGLLVEGYPEAAIVRFRVKSPVERPEWALRVAEPLANGLVGVFAGR